MQLTNTFQHIKGNAGGFLLVPLGKFSSVCEIGGKNLTFRLHRQ